MPHYLSLDAAAKAVVSANRILVIGCSGGGKSTLSQKLCEQLALHYLSIDRDIRWLPGWVVRDENDQRAMKRTLVKQDRWIMDGTSPSSFDIRLPRTDLVLWVSVPRHRALIGLARRIWRNYGTTRPDMAVGCKEQLPDWEFLSYIWTFNKKTAPKVIAGLDQYGVNVPVVMLRSHQEMDSLVLNAANYLHSGER